MNTPTTVWSSPASPTPRTRSAAGANAAQCGRRFTTYEHIEETPLVVIKSSGEREPFDRQKLLSGLQRACHKRQVSTQLLEVAVRDIESELRNRLRQEASSQLIGELTLRRLKEIDQVAYVRFASVYRAVLGRRGVRGGARPPRARAPAAARPGLARRTHVRYD